MRWQHDLLVDRAARRQWLLLLVARGLQALDQDHKVPAALDLRAKSDTT